ncbi:MAG: chemotaxis protein CheD [Thermodesulfobacteriota bacterium]
MKKNVSIHIGELHVSQTPAVIYTLLGSCVAVCLFDPTQGIGGMNHILLPGIAGSKMDDATSRYAHNAIEMLINSLMRLGAKQRNLIAKAFGGAHLLQTISDHRGVGRHLSEFVLGFLAEKKIRIESYDLGGADVRKIYFHTDTGMVLLKRSPMQGFEQFIDREQATVRQLYQKIRKAEKILPVLVS